jgi:hypothetical protein
MSTLKNVMTFEQFSNQYNNSEIVDEKLSDVVKAVGKKVESFITEWDKPENVSWAKKMAPAYVKSGTIDEDLYAKAKEANFDVEDSDVEAFLKAMAKIKAGKTGSAKPY